MYRVISVDSSTVVSACSDQFFSVKFCSTQNDYLSIYPSILWYSLIALVPAPASNGNLLSAGQAILSLQQFNDLLFIILLLIINIVNTKIILLYLLLNCTFWNYKLRERTRFSFLPSSTQTIKDLIIETYRC